MKTDIINLIVYLIIATFTNIGIIHNFSSDYSKSLLFILMCCKTIGDITGLLYIVENIAMKRRGKI